jgi:RES domain
VTIPQSHVRQSRTIRLIASAHHKPPVLQPLAPSFGALSKVEALESVTSARLAAQQKGIPGVAAEALASGYGYTYINAAFAYPRLSGSRFNSHTWGAWYCSFAVDTALEEVTFHLNRALGAITRYENTTHYVELLADFDAIFHDLCYIVPPHPCLDPDVSIGYPLGQQLATELRQAGSNGIVYHSVRHPGGTCLVAFWPGLIQNFQRGEVWKLEWRGDPRPVISKMAAASDAQDIVH